MNKLDEEGFLKMVRKELLKGYLYSILTPVNLPKSKVQILLAQHRAETRNVSVANIPFDNIKLSKQSTEQDQLKFYTNNSAKYKSFERRNADVLYFDKETLNTLVTPTQEETAVFYEQNPNKFTMPEQRTYNQIIVEEEKDAKRLIRILNKAKRLNPTAKYMAKKYKTEYNVNLKLTKNHVPDELKPIFSADKEGVMAEPIKSAFGYHVIIVNKITPEHKATFEEVQDKIKQTLLNNKMKKISTEYKQKVEDHISAGETLTQIAKALNLKIHSYVNVSRAGAIVDQNNHTVKTDIKIPAKVLGEMFSMSTGDLPTFKKEGSQAFFIQLLNIMPSKTLPFKVVKEQVIKDWQSEERIKLANIIAHDVVDSAKEAKNKTLQDLFKNVNVKNVAYKSFDNLGRNDDTIIDPRLQANIFNSNQGQVAFKMLENNDIQIALVNKVNNVKNPDPNVTEQVKQSLIQNIAKTVSINYVNYMKGIFKTEIQTSEVISRLNNSNKTDAPQ